MKKILVALAVAALALGVAVYFLMERKVAPQSKEAPAMPTQYNRTELRYPPGAPQLAFLKIEEAKASPVPALDELLARLAYDENATARIAAPAAGRVVRVMADLGDAVAKGAPLAAIDSPDYAEAVAGVEKAAADRKARHLGLERARMLYQGEVIARKELEQAESEDSQAAADLYAAQARLSSWSQGVAGKGGLVLRAPMAGIVTERAINPGSMVGTDPDKPLFVVTDPTRLWAYIEIPETKISAIHKGQKVGLAADAWPGRVFYGTVSHIADVVDSNTRRVTVRLAVDNGGRQLKPEMFVQAWPVDREDELPRVPNGALVTVGQHSFAFVETSPGVLVRREVGLAFRGRDTTWIASGIKPGERVVTSGALLLDSELAGG